jgi:hypothetical protein
MIINDLEGDGCDTGHDNQYLPSDAEKTPK